MKEKTPRQKPKNRAEMSLLDHLNELRQRLVKAVIALLVAMILGAFITEPTLQILTAPARQADPPVVLQALSPTEAIVSFFRVSMVLGFVLAMPVIIFQAFQFTRPGLEAHETRYILIGVPFASLSFASGVAFATFVVIPNAMPFLSGFLSELVKHQYSLDYYISFVGNILLWSGLVFETPLVMYFLARIGIVNAKTFGKVRRFVVVGAAIGAAIITPTPDALNMLLIMVPFLVLYEVGILLAKLAQRSRERAAA